MIDQSIYIYSYYVTIFNSVFLGHSVYSNVTSTPQVTIRTRRYFQNKYSCRNAVKRSINTYTTPLLLLISESLATQFFLARGGELGLGGGPLVRSDCQIPKYTNHTTVTYPNTITYKPKFINTL